MQSGMPLLCACASVADASVRWQVRMNSGSRAVWSNTHHSLCCGLLLPGTLHLLELCCWLCAWSLLLALLAQHTACKSGYCWVLMRAASWMVSAWQPGAGTAWSKL